MKKTILITISTLALIGCGGGGGTSPVGAGVPSNDGKRPTVDVQVYPKWFSTSYLS